jgi:uncharacterized protein (DUF1697 family)
MTVFVSMLRGINIGGHHEIKMDTLRGCYEALGFGRVQTYLRSGNVVFDADKTGRTRLRKQLEDKIEATCGFRPPIVLRTAAELRRVVKGNPFKTVAAKDPSHLAVLFLDGKPDRRANARLADYQGPEQIEIGEREVYLYYPRGFARSRLTTAFLERRLGVTGTGRSWNTVTRLLTMAEAMKAG